MGQMLPVATFATADLPPRARYEAWRNLISAVFEPSPTAGERVHDWHAEVRSAYFGQILVAGATAQSQHFTRSPRLIAVEELDHYLIQVYRRGVCDGTYGEVQNTVRAGDIKIIDLARPFHTLNTAFDNITLTIPRAALAPLLDDPDGMHGRVVPREDPMAQVIENHIWSLYNAAPGLTAERGASLGSATATLMAACLGAAPRVQEAVRPYRAAAIGQTVRAFIDTCLDSPELGPELLTQRFRMSRRQIYRLFAEDGGVAAYIQARRLDHCLRALTDPAQAMRGIGDIALGFGFVSESHFSRAFRRAFGMTPSEARAESGSAVSADPTAFINHWMRSLQDPPLAAGLS